MREGGKEVRGSRATPKALPFLWSNTPPPVGPHTPFVWQREGRSGTRVSGSIPSSDTSHSCCSSSQSPVPPGGKGMRPISLSMRKGPASRAEAPGQSPYLHPPPLRRSALSHKNACLTAPEKVRFAAGGEAKHKGEWPPFLHGKGGCPGMLRVLPPLSHHLSPPSQCHKLLYLPPSLYTGNLPISQTIKTNQAKKSKGDRGAGGRET